MILNNAIAVNNANKYIAIQMPKPVRFIIDTLEEQGFEAYIVGGCVRDSFLNKTPHDYDICTSAKPDEIIKAFPKNEIIPTGLQHGTVTIVIVGEPYEITTYRIDGAYTDNRRPDSVEFTDNLIEDLKRRDFTINAIAYNPKIGLIDPFHGLDDLKQHKIQCVGNPEDRFSEDALRILRAIRFASQLEFIIEPNTDYVLHKMYKNLENISIERINSEFCKIATSSDFYVQMILYQDVFSLFIPEIKDMFKFPQNNPYHFYDVWNHTVHAVQYCKSDDLVVRLATFFHDIGKPHCYQDGEDGIRHFKGHGRVSADMADKIMKRLRFDNDTREKVVQLVYYHDATFEVGDKYVKRWLNKIGVEQFKRLLELRKADILAQNPYYKTERLKKVNKIENLLEDILSKESCFTLKDLSVNGNDLIEIGYKPGKELGNTLNALLQLVMNNECPNEKEQLLEEARRIQI